MKRHLALLMLLVLVLGLGACGNKPVETTLPTTQPGTEATTAPTTEPTTVPTTEPVTTVVVGGVDLTGMTLEQAAQALNEAAAGYVLNLTVNGKGLTIPAADLGLKLDQAALEQYLAAAESGAELPNALFTYESDALKTLSVTR